MFELVKNFFDDEEKAIIWFATRNPMLGDVMPVTMIRSGNTDKLKRFIETQLNTPNKQ